MNSIYHEVVGNALEPLYTDDRIIIHPHIVNNIGAWGSGFVMAISNLWQEPEEAYHLYSPSLGQSQMVPVGKNKYVFNMCAQNETIRTVKVPIDYKALWECMADLRIHASRLSLMTKLPVEVHAPKFGSDRAGGHWPLIQCMIERVWCSGNSAIDKVVVYEYNQSQFK